MLETSRLKLVPLTHEQLLLYKNNPRKLAENLGVHYSERQHDPATLPDLEEALGFWIQNTEKFPESFEWFTNWEIILKKERIGIGGIGFSGFPDADGKTMVGYGLDLRYHSRGYASEALTALLEWAFQHTRLNFVIADTPLNNIPSQRVLEKNAFEKKSTDNDLIHWQRFR